MFTSSKYMYVCVCVCFFLKRTVNTHLLAAEAAAVHEEPEARCGLMVVQAMVSGLLLWERERRVNVSAFWL